ncbi:hypothetical protein BGZ54_000914 [Gamsiella multidivaricata]|nr:hypothetical protein BGZ54_000914 [Gamsiella multidivaricata]
MTDPTRSPPILVTTNLNSEGRSHSFRRTEQIEREREREREPEDDGLWNSPVGNIVGSFDANGVFRVVGDSEELQPLAEHEESTKKHAADEAKGAGVRNGDNPKSSANATAPLQNQELISSDLGSGKTDQPSPEQQQQQQKLQEKPADSYLFSSGLLAGKNLGSGPLRDDAEFAPFNAGQSSVPNVAPAPESAFDALSVELSKWLYRDPSGSIQGPFSSEEMHEWYKGGFFSPDLLVKREQDPTFEPLGTLIRRIGSEDKPFLLAGIVRQEQPSLSGMPLRSSVPSLAQVRQPISQVSLSSGWIGMSAPTTPSTPSFGVDRLLMQQQQLQQPQQHSSGDLFSSTNNLGQQRSGFGSVQDPGLESRWSSGLFGRTQAVESNAGWGGDTFSRPAMGSMSAAHTPMGGPQYMDQQQRLHNQEIERQQYMQLLQRQSQMQTMVHQQQFMQAQQQFGNDPHALAALLAQQQAQQRQLQMRYQQLQFAGLHAQAVSTPGGTAIPWGGAGMGQPSSPWTTSIIPSSSDNYFEFNKGDGSQVPHSMQQRQQQQVQAQAQHQPFQPFQQEQQQQQHSQEQQQQEHISTAKDSVSTQDSLPTQHDNAAADSLAERLEHLEVRNEYEGAEIGGVKEHATKSASMTEQTAVEDKDEEDYADETFSAAQNDAFEPTTSIEAEYENQQEVELDYGHQEQGSFEENISETASSTAAESTHRTIKASPAPWAKPSNDEDLSERRGPTLREIQEMEAKKAEEAKAERQAQLAAAVSGNNSMLDFTKGMPGAPAWSSTTATTPKKKTLKEIQQEEEAAVKRARAAQQANPSTTPLGAQSPGLAAIVASGTGSIGRRYADTIGPKSASSSTTSGPWGSASAAAIASKPALVTRSSAVFASNPSLNSPTNPVSKGSDSNWIEVGSKHSASVSTSPAVSRTSAPASSSTNKAPSNSNEPRPASEEFLRWCRQALKDLQGVVLEDFIQMLLTFPLNPDPMTVEIISESIYANSKSLNGRQFADEFIKRRKADAYPNGAPASFSTSSSGVSSGVGVGGADSSFKVVSKKGKKKGTA